MAQRIEMKVVLPESAATSIPTLFSNHVRVSRAGTEVQFDFVALDINILATKLNEKRENPNLELQIPGNPVARIVVPLHMFMLLEGPLNSLFQQAKRDFSLGPNEVEQ